MVKRLKDAEDADEEFRGWFNARWRPAMAWQYLAVCVFDFLLAPIMNAIYAEWSNTAYVNWDPLTIRGGGIYHLAMGAVLGIAAWTRGQEKLRMMDYTIGPRTAARGYAGPDEEDDEEPRRYRGRHKERGER